ncbi:MAG: hypothetical protein K0S00_1268 [Xanthobacteraceae bacterium]|jgi:hypothetical protein|nr:hypothetical protein [Xanthobacteraceae bacterium]
MSEVEAARLAQLGAVLLPSTDGARAVLDLPTGMLLVGERHHHTHGQIEEVERFAATLIAACWEARRHRLRLPSHSPPA